MKTDECRRNLEISKECLNNTLFDEVGDRNYNSSIEFLIDTVEELINVVEDLQKKIREVDGG